MDESGQEVAAYEYDAFGNVIEETGDIENPYRYAGYRYDEETGFYYLQSRYYNPETGRFLTRDSFEGTEEEPLSQNKYTYAHNNPVMNIDPDGFAIWFIASVLLTSLFWTVVQMSWNYGHWRYWSKGAFAETFIWNVITAGVPLGFFGRKILTWVAKYVFHPFVNWIKRFYRSSYSP
ncbi:RHS repeat-associated core domain-containing protein [Paludifilum halophilum]|uniref:RHS repeat-associated core domain-containing protein n=1 Tax=Paludifilum halophilum TaxID=1642702 RepID=UPI0034DF63E0